MVPSAFIRLDEFPMTANNKLDRKAFPEPIFEQSNDYVAPRDPIEIELCTTFEQILSVKRVGIHDDFFELGGHSLLAVKLVNHLKRLLVPNCQLLCWHSTPLWNVWVRSFVKIKKLNHPS